MSDPGCRSGMPPAVGSRTPHSLVGCPLWEANYGMSITGCLIRDSRSVIPPRWDPLFGMPTLWDAHSLQGSLSCRMVPSTAGCLLQDACCRMPAAGCLHRTTLSSQRSFALQSADWSVLHRPHADHARLSPLTQGSNE